MKQTLVNVNADHCCWHYIVHVLKKAMSFIISVVSSTKFLSHSKSSGSKFMLISFFKFTLFHTAGSVLNFLIV